jgi:hypothetical protein
MYGTWETCTCSFGEEMKGRHSDRFEDNIKMALQEVGWGGMYWIDLA